MCVSCTTFSFFRLYLLPRRKSKTIKHVASWPFPWVAQRSAATADRTKRGQRSGPRKRNETCDAQMHSVRPDHANVARLVCSCLKVQSSCCTLDYRYVEDLTAISRNKHTTSQHSKKTHLYAHSATPHAPAHLHGTSVAAILDTVVHPISSYCNTGSTCRQFRHCRRSRSPQGTATAPE